MTGDYGMASLKKRHLALAFGGGHSLFKTNQNPHRLCFVNFDCKSLQCFLNTLKSVVYDTEVTPAQACHKGHMVLGTCSPEVS